MTSRFTSSALRALRSRPIATTPSIPRYFTTSTPKMTVNVIENKEQFKEALAKEQLVLLDAFAEWCGPCKAIAPIIDKWSESEEFKGSVYFAKFDVDALPDLAQELGIRAMPTFLLFKDGDKVGDFLGANPNGIQTLIRKHLD